MFFVPGNTPETIAKDAGSAGIGLPGGPGKPRPLHHGTAEYTRFENVCVNPPQRNCRTSLEIPF